MHKEQSDICCICLSTADIQNPLQLLACGCKASWFHQTCENQWLSSMSAEQSPTCPICRRQPAMKINYCFSYSAGDAQKFLWHTLYSAALFEIPLLLYTRRITPILQSSALILFPAVIPCHRDIQFFLLNYRLRLILDIFLCYFLLYDPTDISMLITYRYVHLAMIPIVTYSKNSVFPLFPYAISREIVHSHSFRPSP